MPDEPARPESDPPAPDAGEPATDKVLARLLADPAVWIEAPPSLEGDVVAAVQARADADVRTRRSPPRRGPSSVVVIAAAAAAILAVVLAVNVTSREREQQGDFAAQLTGTQLAPSARASAGITKSRGGFTVMLDAHGLKRLPPDEFYEAWLKNDAGTLVPIGTFSSSDSRITLWSGVSPNDFRTMTVTIERSDGDQSPSGRRVLIGTVRAQ